MTPRPMSISARRVNALTYRYGSEAKGKTLHVYLDNPLFRLPAESRLHRPARNAASSAGKRNHILEAAEAELKQQPEAMRRRKDGLV